jgi:hypothetical protein
MLVLLVLFGLIASAMQAGAAAGSHEVNTGHGLDLHQLL